MSRFLPLLPALLIAPIAWAQSPSSGPEAGTSVVTVPPVVVAILPLEANEEARERPRV